MSQLDTRLTEGLHHLASSVPEASGNLDRVKRLGRRRSNASMIATGIGVFMLVVASVGSIALLSPWGSDADSPAQANDTSAPSTTSIPADAREPVETAAVGGITWNQVVLQREPDRDPGNEAFGARGVAFANGRFVASGPGGIWYSDDLLTWTSVAPKSVANIDGTVVESVDGSGPLAGGPLGFVASIGQGEGRGHTAVLYSEDGATWTRSDIRDPDAWDTLEISDISAGGPGWVAVGRHGRDGRIWTSVDGLTWDTIVDEAFNGVWLSDVSEKDGQLTLIGTPAEGTALEDITALVWVSDDGQKWDSIPLRAGTIGPATHSIAVNPDTGQHIALNSHGVWRSADGVAWREVASDNGVPPYTHPTDNAVWLGDIILGTHRYQDVLFESADGGATWIRTPWPRVGLFVHENVVIAIAGDLWIGTLD